MLIVFYTTIILHFSHFHNCFLPRGDRDFRRFGLFIMALRRVLHGCDFALEGHLLGCTFHVAVAALLQDIVLAPDDEGARLIGLRRRLEQV